MNNKGDLGLPGFDLHLGLPRCDEKYPRWFGGYDPCRPSVTLRNHGLQMGYSDRLAANVGAVEADY